MLLNLYPVDHGGLAGIDEFDVACDVLVDGLRSVFDVVDDCLEVSLEVGVQLGQFLDDRVGIKLA